MSILAVAVEDSLERCLRSATSSCQGVEQETEEEPSN